MNKKLLYFLLATTILLGGTYLVFELLNSYNQINQLQTIINTTFILVIVILVSLLIINENTNSITSKILLTFFSVFFTFNILVNTNIVSLPTKSVMENFTGSTIDQVLTWSSNYNIQVEQIYENSDLVPRYHVISQNITPNSFIDDVKTLQVIISDGPNYDKEVIVPNMIGIDVDTVMKYIDDNFLNNVEIEYIISDQIKDTVVEQSRNGAMKRSDNIKWTFSIGSLDNLEPTTIIDLANQRLFEGTLWLERNGFEYNITYEFSEVIEKNYIISNSNVGQLLDPSNSVIELVVSKGKEIIVPNILEMSTSQITTWVIENKLNITFSDSYDDKIELNKVISANVNVNDIIEEGTTIEIVTSKGPLKMEAFSSLNEFRTWAVKYNVKYVEKYDYNDSISSGNIVSFSINEGQIISNDEEIVVNVSLGKPVTIPNFVGKSKSEITNTCASIGLTCSFYYGGYSNTTKDYALSQNKSSGIEVVSGTSISISLSQGPAATKSVFIQESWLASSASGTISSLRTQLEAQSPGAIFTFVTKASNSQPSGMIHADSPTKGGQNSFTQGQSYVFWIVE